MFRNLADLELLECKKGSRWIFYVKKIDFSDARNHGDEGGEEKKTVNAPLFCQHSQHSSTKHKINKQEFLFVWIFVSSPSHHVFQNHRRTFLLFFFLVEAMMKRLVGAPFELAAWICRLESENK